MFPEKMANISITIWWFLQRVCIYWVWKKHQNILSARVLSEIKFNSLFVQTMDPCKCFAISSRVFISLNAKYFYHFIISWNYIGAHVAQSLKWRGRPDRTKMATREILIHLPQQKSVTRSWVTKLQFRKFSSFAFSVCTKKLTLQGYARTCECFIPISLNPCTQSMDIISRNSICI